VPVLWRHMPAVCAEEVPRIGLAGVGVTWVESERLPILSLDPGPRWFASGPHLGDAGWERPR
jgi:hypothetical protein